MGRRRRKKPHPPKADLKPKPERKQKPIDRWLTLGAAAMGFGQFLLPHDSIAIAICAAAIFGLLIHPVWNFWWVEKKMLRQIIACLTMALGCSVLAYYRWPRLSLVYIVPVYWSPSPIPRWGMIVHHYGPEPVENIEIVFTDRDRQESIRQKYAHGGTLTDQDIAQEMLTLHFSEIDRVEGVWAKQFLWPPASPDDAHFDVHITSREGNWFETMEVRNVGSGPKWAYRMHITDLESRSVLIDCRDAGFPKENEAKALPACFPRYVIPES